MTLSAAASRLGWHRHKVESRARRDVWPRRAPNRGTAHEYLIPASLLAEPPTEPERSHDRAQPDDAMTEAMAELAAEVTQLRTEAAAAKAELTAEQRRSADLSATVSAERARGDRLEAALADARRPWLARMLDGMRRR